VRAYTEAELREAEVLEPQNLPIWREALLGVDWISLRLSPVYRGVGVPLGGGEGVLLIPGFLGSDRYLGELRSWLQRIGYTPYLSGIGRNMRSPDERSRRLHETVIRAMDETGGKVHLVGHTLGGIIARSVAVRWSEAISSIITMGSPFRGVRAHPFILWAAGVVRRRITTSQDKPASATRPECYTGRCDCKFVEALKTVIPSSVAQTAIFTRTDGVVDWQRCLNDDPDLDIEVQGTHAGLAFNPAVYEHIARRLAAASVSP
jgi:pimeloyl-ACP methyl ester carboxylesterase